MIHIELSGSPYAIGLQHGQKLRPLVDGMVHYEMRLHSHAKETPPDLDAMHDRLKKKMPEYLEELQGIADGAAIPFDILLEINLRILHFCTVIAFTTTDQGPLLGKNLDFPMYAYQVLMTVNPKSGHSFTHIGCAGTVGSYGGLNQVGLAMGHAVVPLKGVLDNEGLPLAFIRRKVLQYSSDSLDAVVLLSSHDAWQMGDNILFLDKGGNAAVVEMQPGTQNVRQAVENKLWCSNCFVHPACVLGNPESHGRYAYMDQTLKDKTTLDRSFLTQLLRSHEGEYPLCRNSTQLSFVASPSTGKFEVADGYPCQVRYVNANEIK